MNEIEAAEKILHTMLGKLGFEVDLETTEQEDGYCLNIVSEDSAVLIGKQGDRLEDLQYLTNRVLCKHYPDSPRVKVDCDYYRTKQEEKLIENATKMASQVFFDGKSRKLKPLNAYYRRLAYKALGEIQGIKTSSPSGEMRYKSIEISKL
ncbi:MAG: protein jag [Akkermansiaceae bacterium]